jgi:hypothetical protein
LPAAKLIEILRAGGAASPDLAAAAEAIIAKLEAAIPLGNLIVVAEALPRELANIAQGKLDPRPDQPSNAA